MALLVEQGFDRLTVEAIARRSGTSKQTIYRWWPNRSAILVEAVRDLAAREAPLPRSGDLHADTRALVRRTTELLAGPEGQVLAALMSQAQLDPEFGESFRTGFLAPRREALRDVMTTSVSAVSAESAERASELVFSMLWYRLLARSGPMDQEFADAVTEAAIAASSPCLP